MSANKMHSPTPSHMQYEQAWELANAPNPELLADYLSWLHDDNDRIASAVESMQWLPPGFNTFLVARQVNPDGTTRRSLQLNLYHADYPGNEEPHGHSRNARTHWYAQPSTEQIISRYSTVSTDAPSIPGLDLEEHVVAGNCIVDLKDGRRPLYNPVELGRILLMKSSVSRVATLGSQTFASPEVHHIGFRGKGVAISAHYKGPEEDPRLSEVPGLMYFKGTSHEEAEELVRVRQSLAAQSIADSRLGPITMMYMSTESAAAVETVPASTPAGVAEELILGAIHTVEQLKKT